MNKDKNTKEEKQEITEFQEVKKNESKKIKTKDLILIGVYTALYLIALLLGSSFGFIPQIYPFTLIIMTIFGGIPFMLFLTKVKKFGVVSIMGLTIGLLFFATGSSWPILCFLPFVILSDFIMFRFGKYKDTKFNIIGYCTFSMMFYGLYLLFFIYREKFLGQLAQSVSEEYAQTVNQIMGNWVLYASILFIIVGSIIGGSIGSLVVKKHFKKAGIVDEAS